MAKTAVPDSCELVFRTKRAFYVVQLKIVITECGQELGKLQTKSARALTINETIN